MSKKHYFILAVQVLYLRDSIERSRNFNVLLTNDNPFVNRHHLGLAQQQAQIRFRNEFDPKGTAEIKDVFIMSVNNLGEMNLEEFHEGFEIPAHELAEETQPDQAPEITQTETVTETPVADAVAPEAVPQPELEPAPPTTPAVPDTTNRTPMPTPDEPDAAIAATSDELGDTRRPIQNEVNEVKE